MSDTPAGTPTPAGPTGPGAVPGALDGRVERSDDLPFSNQQQTHSADAAEPLFASLDARQKAIFIDQMVRLSRERGLD